MRFRSPVPSGPDENFSQNHATISPHSPPSILMRCPTYSTDAAGCAGRRARLRFASHGGRLRPEGAPTGAPGFAAAGSSSFALSLPVGGSCYHAQQRCRGRRACLAEERCQLGVHARGGAKSARDDALEQDDPCALM